MSLPEAGRPIAVLSGDPLDLNSFRPCAVLPPERLTRFFAGVTYRAPGRCHVVVEVRSGWADPCGEADTFAGVVLDAQGSRTP
ncbi:hypothetical protein GCM10027258_84830 [Amycolatopsis stemonae]